MAELSHILIVAGSDSSGGAGIVRDIEATTILGARAAVAITAVTAQTHRGVEAVEIMPADLVAAQMRAALAANNIGAVKIGMLATRAIVDVVADLLEAYRGLPVVLDPVIASSSGLALIDGEGLAALKARLLPRADLLTPNLPELAELAGGTPAENEADAIARADMLIAAGARAILVKGGHGSGDKAVDLLVRPGRPPVRFETPRLPATMRGTGCALASAIAATLAQGENLDVSIGRAKHTVFDMIGKAMRGR